MKRLFAAIKIHPSEKYLSTFGQITRALQHERIKWAEPENMHLTLNFFSETPEEKIPAIEKALQAATAGIKPFTLTLNGTGIFGSRYDPKVIWFGMDKNDMLQQLAHQIFVELEKASFTRDRQNFVPHLTIGRVKELKDKHLFQKIIPTYKDAILGEETISGIILFESILHREGSEYKVVRCFKFEA